MKLERINKEWITVDDFATSLGISYGFAKFCLNFAGLFTIKSRKINGIRYYGSLNANPENIKFTNRIVVELVKDVQSGGYTICSDDIAEGLVIAQGDDIEHALRNFANTVHDVTKYLKSDKNKQ